jgi:inorganic pyrophosphatase
MAKAKKPSNPQQAPLSCLPVFDKETGDITIVVETPKGSPNKYDYDPECGALRLAAVLGEGLTFPHDFGFIPSTLGEDGDPLDVLVLLDHAVPAGTIATARLIGVIEARQREKKQPWIRNDRLLAVATHAHTHEQVQDLTDLRPHMLDEVESFFGHYNSLKGKEFEVIARKGPKQALRLLKDGMRAFEKQRKKK